MGNHTFVVEYVGTTDDFRKKTAKFIEELRAGYEYSVQAATMHHWGDAPEDILALVKMPHEGKL